MLPLAEYRYPTRASLGTASLSTSSLFVFSSGAKLDSPLTLPPGRARLATKPAPTGSGKLVITMGMVLLAPFATNGVGPPEATIRSTLRRTRSAASSGSRSSFCSANRYSMVMFFPSIHPSLLSSCRNASKLTAPPEAVVFSRKPMRGTFPVCCASASETFAKKSVASSQRMILFFMFFFLPRAFSLFSFDHFIRPIQHRLRNRQTDLLRGLEIDHQLELRRLLYRQIGGLGSLQDSIHVICDAPIAVRLVRPVGHETTDLYEFSILVHRRQPAL